MKKTIPRAPSGLSPEMKLRHLRVLAQHDLKRVARLCRKKDGIGPSQDEYQEHGRHGITWIMKIAGGKLPWSKAMSVFHLKPAGNAVITNNDDMIEDLRRVALELGNPRKMPTTSQYQKHGRYSSSTVNIRLGGKAGWYGAAMAAGLSMNVSRALHLQPEENLISMYKRTAANLGYQLGGYGPSASKFEELTGIKQGSIQYRFKRWSNFVQKAGFKARPSGGRQTA